MSNHNAFTEAWNAFLNPANFQAYTNKFNKIDWDQWFKNSQEQNAQHMENAQNIVAINAQNAQQNTQALLEVMKKNLSANNFEQVVANQYELLKDIARNNIENFKDALNHASVATMDNYSNWANTILDQLQQNVDSNNK